MTIEQFIKKYGGHYKNYRGGWLIQCPLGIHTDNSPSCSVSINGLFNCWSCGAQGNYTRLLHDVAKFSWKRSSETVEELGLRKAWTKEAKRIYAQDEKPVLSEAVLGLYDVDWHDGYEIYRKYNGKGQHRPPWALVFDKGFLPDTLTHFEAGYDADDQRITIPIWNYKKKLLGILGRACRSGEFKYVPYLKFRYTDHVYNIHATEFAHPVILVEGAMDVWMLHQWKIPFTAIATMASSISEQQVSDILEKHTDISIFYDNDPAGWKGAAQAAKRLLHRGGHVSIINTTRGITNIKDMDHDLFMRAYLKRHAYPCAIGDASTLSMGS